MAAQVISGRFDRTWRNITSAVSVWTSQDCSLFERLLPANRCVTTNDLIQIARSGRRQQS
ncbi:hypothetical protein [Methylobacterium planeticum]|uniref:Uncharacterized protein n=1 Tax=Methylobacterium planeticum TaxID=2615211 RepID=A0A6N6MFK7_9HYPH|nr:hypothetical protein [Methylobacterium planeticum]KAB1069603.1 hypothetical protein F6X51_24735 [Methylobacterium planeticum]